MERERFHGIAIAAGLEEVDAMLLPDLAGPRAGLVVIMLLTLVLIGCRGTAPGRGASSPAMSTPTAPASASPTPTPSPTLVPDEALHVYLADRGKWLYATFTGTYESGEVAGDFSGTYRARRDDFSMTTAFDVAAWGVKQSEQRFVHGSGFESKDGGRWYATENVYLEKGLASMIDAATWVEGIPAGWLNPERFNLRRLAAAIGALPANLTIRGTDEVDGAVAIKVAADGTLIAMEAQLAITSTIPGGDPSVAEWSFSFAFDPDRNPILIRAPADVWRQEMLGVLALIELPAGFERVDIEGDRDLFFAPDDAEIGIGAYPAQGLSPAENYDMTVEYLASPEGFGSSIEVNEPISIGGNVMMIGDAGEPAERPAVEGRLIALHTVQDGVEWYYAVALVQMDRVYLIHWYGPSDGSETEQLSLFREIVSTFVPLGGG